MKRRRVYTEHARMVLANIAKDINFVIAIYATTDIGTDGQQSTGNTCGYLASFLVNHYFHSLSAKVYKERKE
jgi:hypothetical protein